MSQQEYTRSVTTNFTGLAADVTVPSLAQLEQEIRDSGQISIALAFSRRTGDSVSIYFADNLSTPEETALDLIIGSHTGVGLTDPTSSSGAAKVYIDGGQIEVIPPHGEEKIFGTVDFANPTTWHEASLRVTETLVAKAGTSDLVWESPTGKVNWIDLVHGLCLNEDEVSAGKTVVISSAHTAAAPFEEAKWTGEDCWIDYENGSLVFQTAPASPPTVSFNYATDSRWYMSPTPGKVLAIEDVTAQFSVGAQFAGPLAFVVQVPNGVGGWVDVSTKVYKTRRQLQQDAMGAFPIIKASLVDPNVVGKYTRGYVTDTEEIPFRYAYTRPLDSAYGMRLCIRILNDRPMIGESAVATFYCKSEDSNA